MLRTELDPGDLQNRLIMLQDNIYTFSSRSQAIPKKGRVNTPVWRHWKRDWPNGDSNWLAILSTDLSQIHR